MRDFARLPRRPQREAIDLGERPDYDLVVERTSRVHGTTGPAAQYFDALLSSPPLAAALTQLGTQVRRGSLRGTYSDAEREFVDIALAMALGSNAILQIHIPDALAVGVRMGAVEAMLEDREGDLIDDERECLTYVQHVVEGTVSDEHYDAIRSRLGDRGAVEFTVLVGFLLMTIRLWQAFGISEPSREEIMALLTSIRSGAMCLPDQTDRIG